MAWGAWLVGDVVLPWTTMVTWHWWVGVTDDGGGWKKIVWLLTMPNQMSAFSDAHLGR